MMAIRFSIYLGCLCIISICSVQAQKYHIKVYGLPENITWRVNKTDSSQLAIVSKHITQLLQSKGYWLASHDSLSIRNDSARFYITPGRKFESLTISSNLEEVDIDQALDIKAVNQYIEGVLNEYENRGYPFAQITVDSVGWQSSVLHLKLATEPGLLIKNDSLQIDPDGLISERFLMTYLGLKYDKPYSEQQISRIERQLKNLPFVRLKDASISFRRQKAQVVLALEEEKISYFDGVLGMVPNQDGGGVEFTGELNLSVQNLFKSAKSIELHWQRLRPESQLLNAVYSHPMFLTTPLNLNLSFDQIKQDSSFSNRSISAGFDYFIVPELQMKLLYENKLGNDLESITENTGDFEINQYRLGMAFNNFDNPINPRSGWFVDLAMAAGGRRISSGFTNTRRSTQYDVYARINRISQLGPRISLSLNVECASLFNDRLFLNDLYRLGGLRSIRGFNEGEFFAAQYIVSNWEGRYYLDSSSYLLVFYDQGFMSYDIPEASYFDRPVGLGAGLQMNTENGNFLVIYGLGKRKEESFSFDSSKIHFGYRAVF